MPGFMVFLCLQVFVAMPQFIRTPVLAGFAVLVLGLRVWYLQKQKPVAKLWLWFCIGLGLAGLVLLHSGFTVESAADFLTVVYLLKTLESKKQQETLYQLYLSFLIIASSFLFYQGLLITLYGFVAVVFVLAYMHFLQTLQSFKASIKFSSVLVVSAIPLMLVAFYLFPRLPPLWQMPNSKVGQTGLPDEMTSGDIAKLIQNDELVFRVRFTGEIPKQQQLYWRALVLNQFDGKRWRANKLPAKKFVPEQGQKTINYQMFLEPNQHQRFYFLNKLASYPKQQMAWYENNTLGFKHQAQKNSFKLQSALAQSFADTRPNKRENLQLPEGNLKTKQLVQSFREQGLQGMALVQQAQTFFREQAFFYTLEPPLLQGDRIDDFLFNSRKGFCEHYAASFVVMMRYAGIPARVVLGYQGGQVNPYDNSLAVRQLDAHAWAEVWLEGRWHRVDPTAAVAPERILQSSEETLSQDPGFFSESLLLKQKYQWYWLKQISYRLQQWDFWWQNQVLSFDADSQQGLLKTIFGENRYRNMLISLLVFFALLMAGFWYFLLRDKHKKPLSAEEKLLQQFLKRCQQASVIKKPHQGAYSYCQELAKQYPNKAENIQQIANLYMQLHYQQGLTESQRQSLLGQLSRAVMHFRLP